MTKTLSRTAALAGYACGALVAQQPNVEDAIAAGGCLACGGSMLLLPIIIIAINIALLVWVSRDSKARGMDNSVGWILLVLFTSVIGLVVYLLSRPQGMLTACPHCGGKRLEASAKCPQCGND